MRNKNNVLALAAVCGMIGIGSWLMAATTTTQSSNTSDLSAAQENLQKMLEQTPPITAPTLPMGEKNIASPKGAKMITPVVPGQAAQGATNHKLWPEGHYIADRRGRLVKSGDSWMFVFESDGKSLADPPINVLPNRWLEKMESDVAASHEALIFQVSGEVTVFHNANYLLLRKVLIERESTSNFR
jgi:hypothetical protein